MKTKQIVNFMFIYILVITLNACKKDCNNEVVESYTIIQPIETYIVQASKDVYHPEFYLLKSTEEIEEILISKFKYNGSYTFIEGEQILIGIPVFINFGVFEPLDVTFKTKNKDNSLLINVKVKEIVKTKDDNPRCISSWFKLTNSFNENNDIKINIEYELQN